jgi:hypothetical protein
MGEMESARCGSAAGQLAFFFWRLLAAAALAGLATADAPRAKVFAALPAEDLAGDFAAGFAADAPAAAFPAAGGSPVAALATSPPPSFAIPASKRLLTTDFGLSKVMSAVEAY